MLDKCVRPVDKKVYSALQENEPICRKNALDNNNIYICGFFFHVISIPDY